jgi:hypothetical protein
MVGRCDHAAVPAVAGQHDQFVEIRNCLGRDTEIGLPADGELADLHRAALDQPELDARVTLAELFDDSGQCVTRLGMRGGNGQRACVLI